MKKRFTDADIWKKAWFRKLSPKLKGLFNYIKDNCDQAGVWEVDFEMATMCIGDTVSEEDLGSFEDRVLLIDKDKVLLVDFVKFQNGYIFPVKNNVQKNIASLLDRHGLDQDKETKKIFIKKAGAGQGLPKSSPTSLVKVKEEVTVKEQVRRNEESNIKKTNVVAKATSNSNVTDLDSSRRFNFFGLDERLGVTDSDFHSILKAKKLTFKQIQDSIEHFEFSLSNGKIKSMKGTPRDYFFGIITKGNTYNKHKDFISKSELDSIKAKKLEEEENKLKEIERIEAEESENKKAWDELMPGIKEVFYDRAESIVPEEYLEAARSNGAIERTAYIDFVKTKKESSRTSEQGLSCTHSLSETQDIDSHGKRVGA